MPQRNSCIFIDKALRDMISTLFTKARLCAGTSARPCELPKLDLFPLAVLECDLHDLAKTCPLPQTALLISR